jgi:Flp pilus assembly protein CpaB
VRRRLLPVLALASAIGLLASALVYRALVQATTAEPPHRPVLVAVADLRLGWPAASPTTSTTC